MEWKKEGETYNCHFEGERRISNKELMNESVYKEDAINKIRNNGQATTKTQHGVNMKNIFIVCIIALSFVRCAAVYQPIDITPVNEKTFPIDKKLLLSKIQEIYRYEWNKIEYDNKIKARVEFKKFKNNISEVVHYDSSGLYFAMNIDRVKNISEVESILARQIGFALYHEWTKSMYGTSSYYWDTGVITWLAGKYYLKSRNYVSFSNALQSIISNGDYLDFENYLSSNKISMKEWHNLNLESASFIDFLVTNYGLNYVYNLSLKFMDIDNRTRKELLKNKIYKGEVRKILYKKNKGAYKTSNRQIGVASYIRENRNNRIVNNYFYRKAYKDIFGLSYDELIVQWLNYYAN